MYNRDLNDSPIFHGRRKGRKLSKSNELALKIGSKYIIDKEDFEAVFLYKKNIILEIGFGDGENLINSAKQNSNFFYIGADPFLNAIAKCLNKLLLHNLKNVLIWPDDVRKILKLFPYNSISEIKILFPDPWPKIKHYNRRLIQNEFIEILHQIIKPKGTITISTDHDMLKNWILEKFQNCRNFDWVVKRFKRLAFKTSRLFSNKI